MYINNILFFNILFYFSWYQKLVEYVCMSAQREVSLTLLPITNGASGL